MEPDEKSFSYHAFGVIGNLKLIKEQGLKTIEGPGKKLLAHAKGAALKGYENIVAVDDLKRRVKVLEHKSHHQGSE